MGANGNRIRRWVVVSSFAAVAVLPVAASAQAMSKGTFEMALDVERWTLPQSREFARALKNGTRARNGEPGGDYWQQWANYEIWAELDPTTQILIGTEQIWYFNNSPDDLGELYLHLRPNLFEPKSNRNTEVPSTGGIELGIILVNGDEVAGVVDGTILRVGLSSPLAAADSIRLDLAWSYPVPPNAPRSGFDGEVYFLAYWYPQMAVYDDLSGWNIDQYLGNAEFYMGYGDYKFAITVPEGYIVGATGSLVNPEDVLTESSRARLALAAMSRETVNIVSPAEQGAGLSTLRGEDGRLTWAFEAVNVRDVTWSTSAGFVWDATHAIVGDIDGDGATDTTAIHSLYRARSRGWLENARYSQASIEVLSDFLWPYPYPHMTVVEGPQSCGGMEYPMMTCIGTGAFDTPEGLYNVTEHEIGHMWFPMQVGSNEKAHAWMDEGLTQYNEIPGMADMFPLSDVRAQNRNIYLAIINAGLEEPLMTHGDRFDSDFGYGVASYFKPATALVVLNRMLGEDLFLESLREYGRRWVGKHPSPWDLFHTFNDVTGQDLDWFWRTWFFETWALDQSIGPVTESGEDLEVIVESLGDMHLPAFLTVEYADGSEREFVVPVDGWLDGDLGVPVNIPDGSDVVSIQIDREALFPDTDNTNQLWTR